MRSSETGNLYAGKTNFIFLLAAICLSAIGIFFIYDFTSDSYLTMHRYATGQMASLLLGLACAFIVSGMDYHLLCSLFALPFFGILSLLSFLGRYQIFPDIIQMADYRYLQIGSMSINLSDLALFSVCLVISLIIYKSEDFNAMTMLLLGVFCWSLFFFDARIAMIVLMIGLAALFLKKPLTAVLYSALFLLIAIFAFAMIYHSDQIEISRPGSREAMDMWLHPADYNWNTGYGVGQSVYAIACGGIFGTGIGTGVAASDLSDDALQTYILSGITGEIGWFGTLFILTIYIMFFWEAVKIAQRAADKFGFYLAAVINIKFMSTLILNLFVSVNILPYTKNGPPFIGYGGSELIVDFFLMGIMLNISRQGTAVSRR